MIFSNLSRLRGRLAFIIAVALAPAGVLAVVQAINAVGLVSEQRSELQEAEALDAIDTERDLLIEIRQVLRAVARETRAAAAGESCLPQFQKLSVEFSWLLDGFILNENGETVCATGEAIDVGGLSGWESFRALPGYTLSAVRQSKDSDRRVLLAYYPVNEASRDIAAVGFSIDVGSFQAISTLYDGDIDVALLDRDGQIVTKNDAEKADWLPVDRSKLQVFGDRRITEVDALGNESAYFVSSLVEGQLWAVLNDRPQSLTSSLASFAGLSILAPIVIWLIAVFVAYFAIDILVTRHIATLRRAALRIGEGDLDTSVGDYREAPSEIRALGVSIRAMRDKIADREAQLTETLDLQRRLLLEIHHRVKNNLQTISSLMNLESDRIRSPEARDVIGAIQARVHSLAMVHQNLYAAENLEEVALDQLTRDIASHLEDSLSRPGETGITQMELDHVVAPTTLATPISLFLSEALGNAFKHAETPADIHLSLRDGKSRFLLAVSNRAKPPGAEADGGSSGMGLELMRGFAKQIGADFTGGRRDDGRYEVALSIEKSDVRELFSVRHA